MKFYYYLFLLIIFASTVIAIPLKPKGISLSEIKAYADSEVLIERLRKQKQPDWNKISNLYNDMAEVVKQADSKWHTDYDTEIRSALEKCQKGEKTKVNQQILAKGLQHIAVMYIQEALSEITESKDAVKRVEAFYNGIRPTLVRRDKDFFNKSKTLEKAADTAISKLLKAESNGDLYTYRLELENTLMRTYALSVLYEIIKIEKLADIDTAACDVKKMEAVIFYRIIEPKIKKKSKRIHGVINNIINGNYNTMKASVLETYLQQGLPGIKLR